VICVQTVVYFLSVFKSYFEKSDWIDLLTLFLYVESELNIAWVFGEKHFYRKYKSFNNHFEDKQINEN